MKTESQSVPPRAEVNYLLHHTWQLNDGEMLSALLENTADSIYFKDLESRFLKISHALAKKLQLHHPDEAVGKSDSDFFAQAHAQEALEDERRIIRTGIPLLSKEERETWPDGTETWVLTSKMALLDTEGVVAGTFGISHDITAKKTAENALWQAEEKYRAIFEDAVVGIFQITPEGRPLSINRALAHMHGFDSPEQLMAEVSDVAADLFVDPSRMNEFRRILAENGVVRGVEVQVYRRDRTKKWVSANMRAVREADGPVSLLEGMVEDITDRKLAEERVQFLAYYDALTGLPNRTLLRDRLETALAGARRRKEKVALLFVDLDRFKVINDSLGHSVGDLLLQEVGERLRKWARAQDTVARIGGDEFLIALTSVKDTPDAAVAAERIMDAMTPEFVVQGRSFSVTCSIGISMYPDHGADGEALIKNADAAMYSAKESGRNAFRFFTDDMNSQAVERLTIEHSLRGAMDRAELFLVYQPQVNAATGEIVGFEALLRWQHPELGLVRPDKFIHVAENSGLIIPIGEWVLRTACATAREWQRQGLPATPIAVNVSPVQFRNEGFCGLIRRVLLESSLSPEYLELELTENVLLSSADVTLPTLQELKAMGVTLAIDDFGTGYSSLSYLRQFPVSKLKIDRSFIQDVALNPDDAAITAAIINMAKSLNLRVIAEGVENEAQMSFLRDHHCGEIQGYYFSRPLSVVDAAESLRRTSKAWAALQGQGNWAEEA